MAKGFNRILDSEKNKKKLLKEKHQAVSVKQKERFESVKTNQTNAKGDLREKENYLRLKDKQRGKLITEIKEALKEDID